MRLPNITNNGKNDLENTVDYLNDLHKNDPGSYLQFGSAQNDDQNVLKYVFYQSSQMRKACLNFTDVLHVDGTYKLNSLGYVLYPFVVIDNNNKNLTTAIVLVSDTTSFTLTHAFEMFQKANPEFCKKVQFCVTDKAKTEINSLQKLMPNCQFILCQWHAKNSILTYIDHIHLSSKEQPFKEILKQQFFKLLYTKSQESFDKTVENLEKTCKMSISIQPFFDYFMKNWYPIRNMWASYKLCEYEILNSFTNNRSESNNAAIKKFVDKHSKFLACFKGLINFTNDQFSKHDARNHENSNKIFKPLDASSEAEVDLINIINKWVSKDISDKVRNEFKEALVIIKDKKVDNLSLNFKQSSCTLTQGYCKIKTFKIPCRHLFATKMINDENLIEKTFFSTRWFKDQTISLVTPQDPKTKFKTLTCNDKERYNSCSKILNEIRETLSRSTDNERLEMSKTLEILNEGWIDDNDKTPSNKGDTPNLSFYKRKNRHHLLKDKNESTPKKIKRSFVSTFDDIIEEIESPLQEIKDIKKDPEAVDQVSLDTGDWKKDLNAFYNKLGKWTWVDKDFDSLITPNAWLNDSNFEWVNALIKAARPEIQGLEYVQNHCYKGFKAVLNRGVFIQIINTGHSHWVVLSNAFIKESQRDTHVSLYDSLMGEPTEMIKQQVCQLLCNDTNETKSKQLVIQYESCQQQNDSSSCGLFAIANACAIASGLNPSFIYYTGNLREECIEMLKNKKMTNFAYKNVQNHNLPQFKDQKTIEGINMNVLKENHHLKKTFEKVCFCRMHEAWNDTSTFTCTKCKGTFHLPCNFLSKFELKNLKKSLCLQCRNDTSVFTGEKLNEKDDDKIKRFKIHIGKN